MRNIKSVLLCMLASVLMISCIKDEDSEDYSSWREANEAYFKSMRDSIDPKTGEKLYREVQCLAYPQYYVLFRETEAGPAENTLKPLYTSTVKVSYTGHLYNTDTDFDEGTLTLILNKGFYVGNTLFSVIQGWPWAIMEMTVGEKAEVIIPWQLAYGSTGSGSILPYSTLIFNMTLDQIVKYETGSN